MDHVAAVFVSNIQILSCVRLDTENKKDIHIKIPTRDSFIHKVLIQCAENIFQDPLLFWHEISYGEKRENTKKKQSLIDESIKEAIREMLPIQDILKEYLAETGKNNSQKDTPDKDDDRGLMARVLGGFKAAFKTLTTPTAGIFDFDDDDDGPDFIGRVQALIERAAGGARDGLLIGVLLVGILLAGFIAILYWLAPQARAVASEVLNFQADAIRQIPQIAEAVMPVRSAVAGLVEA